MADIAREGDRKAGQMAGVAPEGNQEDDQEDDQTFWRSTRKAGPLWSLYYQQCLWGLGLDFEGHDQAGG
eukprot:superscaffoldBa00003174_g16315